MGSVNFKVNNKLEILWNDNYYKSNIQDITDDYIAISIPTITGSYVPLAKGDRIEVLYYDALNIYKFNTVVTGRKFQRIPIILLKKPSKIQKIQRRKFVRVPLVKYVNYNKIPLHKTNNIFLQQNDNNNEENEFKKAVLLDLSGGGMRLKVSEKVSLGDTILVSLSVNGEELNLKGEIVRVNKDEEGKNDCGVNFIELEEKVRERIIQFIFKLMRNQRKKV